MTRSGQCRTCRGVGKISEMRSRLVKGELIIIEKRVRCFTCQGQGRL